MTEEGADCDLPGDLSGKKKESALDLTGRELFNKIRW